MFHKKVGLWGIDATSRQTGKSKKDAKKLLEQNVPYQRTAPRRKRDIKYAKIIAKPRDDLGRPDQVQGDLLDMHQNWKFNGGHKFILVLVDVYSRRAWFYALKNKGTKEIMRTHGPFLRKIKPHNIIWDRESSVRSKALTAELKKIDCKRWHPDKNQPDDFKGATSIVERLNRTLRTWLTRYMLQYKTKRWVDVLPDFEFNYNHKYHRSIRMSPMRAWETNDVPEKGRPIPTLEPGTLVRARLTRSLFEKKTKPAWSDAVYKVREKTGQKYVIENASGKAYRARLPYQDLRVVEGGQEPVKEVKKRVPLTLSPLKTSKTTFVRRSSRPREHYDYSET